MNTAGTKTIETERLVLRRYVVDDAPDMYANWTSDPEVTKFMPWPTHESPEFTRDMLTEWVSYYDDGGTYNWGITLKGEDKVIGNIAVVSKDENIKSFEIGYCLGRDYWGRGIMPEALRSVIRYLFDNEKDLMRIMTSHDTRNRKSGRVMQKAGMTYEGTIRASKVNKQGIHDTAYYSVLRSDIVSKAEYEKLFHKMRPGFFERDYIKAIENDDVYSEMMLRLQSYVPVYSKTLPENITFGFFNGDIKDLHEAVAKVNPKWVKYFREGMRFYCGYEDGKIVSFCIVEEFGEHEVDGMIWKIAGPGCVGTVPEYRDRGIALTMISNVTELLRDELYDYSYIHYTHVQKWYEKLGYRSIVDWNRHGFC